MKLFKILMNTVTEGGAGGGGQNSGTLVTGGGDGGNSSGGQNSGGGDSSNANGSGDKAASANSGGNNTSDWKSALPTELQSDPSLKTIGDVTALAKSYVSAQKMIGSEKIVIPSKHATDEDWKQVFTKLGLPQELKDYAVDVPKDAAFDGIFVKGFSEAAYKAGILPKQAQAMVNWFNESNNKRMTEFSEGQAKERAKGIDGLKSEWGNAFDAQISRAKQALKLNDPDGSLSKYLDKTGLGNDAQIVKLLAKVGESLKEDGVTGQGGDLSRAKTPDSALKEINTIRGDKAHPYNVGDHPNHKKAVEEMHELFKHAYPSSGPKK